MNNQINFTGIQNIGSLAQVAIDFNTLQPLRRKYLVAQLTNDCFGKDFDKYIDAFKSCNQSAGLQKFPYDDHFVHIMTETPLKKDVPSKVFLNFKELPVNDKTLKLYSFIAKLTRTLGKLKPKQYEIAKDFKFGPDGDRYIMGDCFLSDFAKNEEDYKRIVNVIYNPDSVSLISKSMNDDIQKKMVEYFG